MTIQRRPNVPFAQIANDMLRDKRLSFKARGILAMVLSHAEEWDAQRDWIEEQSDRDGRDAVQSALKELNDLGYRRVVKEQLPDGTFHTVVEWFQTPNPTTTIRVIRPPENPSVGSPDGRQTRPSTEDNLSEDNKQKTRKEKNTAADAAFTTFWETYPRRAAKGDARKAFTNAMKKTSAADIIAGAARFRDDPNRQPQFTPHPATWLNRESWNDEPIPTPIAPMTPAQARAAATKRELDTWLTEQMGETP